MKFFLLGAKRTRFHGPSGTLRAGDIEELFRRTDYADFDQLPVAEGNRIVGIVERSNPKVRRPLDDSVLVAADNPLSNFIRTISQQPYRLVVDGTAITGIVTWSDLLKLPVTVLAFSLVAQLELAMNFRIEEKYGEEAGWISSIKKKERKSGRLCKLQKENLALSVLELADFAHKAKVLREQLSANRDFERDLKSLKSLRDETQLITRDEIRVHVRHELSVLHDCPFCSELRGFAAEVRRGSFNEPFSG